LRLLKRNLENKSNEMAELSPLRRRMIEDMTIRNLSPATQRSYVHAVAKFSRHFCRSPDRLGLEEVRVFQVYLVSQGISWPALNQTVCALRFFYGVTLGHPAPPLSIARPGSDPAALVASLYVWLPREATVGGEVGGRHASFRWGRALD
jgi:hypothetical protein